jgi:hypothetical protein
MTYEFQASVEQKLEKGFGSLVGKLFKGGNNVESEVEEEEETSEIPELLESQLSDFLKETRKRDFFAEV